MKKFKATTNSDHSLPVAENLLEQNFAAEAPNQIWVTDITYIPTAEGWLYLAGHKDLFNGEVVGYAMGERMTKNLVSQSLFRAVSAKRPAAGLIHHSDRGSQYCALEYQKLLAQFGMQASMSRRGNCYDNAPIESFWGTLKNELVHHRRYATRWEAMQRSRNTSKSSTIAKDARSDWAICRLLHFRENITKNKGQRKAIWCPLLTTDPNPTTSPEKALDFNGSDCARIASQVR